jgi:hypothetical protein
MHKVAGQGMTPHSNNCVIELQTTRLPNDRSFRSTIQNLQSRYHNLFRPRGPLSESSYFRLHFTSEDRHNLPILNLWIKILPFLMYLRTTTWLYKVKIDLESISYWDYILSIVHTTVVRHIQGANAMLCRPHSSVASARIGVGPISLIKLRRYTGWK